MAEFIQYYTMIYNQLFYFLFFIKNSWSYLNEDKKRKEEDYIYNKIRKYQKKYNDGWNLKGKCIGIIKSLMAYTISLNESERENIISFLSETKVLSVLTRNLYCMGSKSIKYDLVRDFLDLINDKKKKYTIICCIYGSCDIESQNYMSDFLESNPSCMRYNNVVYGLYSGAISYNESVEKIFIEKIRNSSVELLEDINEDNPIYILSYLRICRFITKRQLERYKEYIDRSLLLLFLIYPMFFSWDLFRDEWNYILTSKEYRKYMEDNV